MLAADRDGIEGARSLTNPRYHLEPVSKTFHARDLFAPVAAHLAAGAHFDDLGDDVDLGDARAARPARRRGSTTASSSRRSSTIDRFGNLGLNVSAGDIDALGVADGDRVELAFALTPYYAVVGETYADAPRGELIVYEDSYGAWAIAINGGNAAALTEAGVDDEVRIRPV